MACDMKQTLTILALCLFTALGQAAEPLELNVRNFDAKGDGNSDDTAAFLAAIAEGTKRKLPVRVPQGSYVITQPLVLRAAAHRRAERLLRFGRDGAPHVDRSQRERHRGSPW